MSKTRFEQITCWQDKKLLRYNFPIEGETVVKVPSQKIEKLSKQRK